MANVYEIVTEKVLAAMAAGVAPWRQVGRSVDGAGPRSMSTRREYRGCNVVLLSIAAVVEGYSSPWWGTYEQVKGLGGQVRSGQKSTLVVFWKRTERRQENEDGEEETRRGFLLRYFSVFSEQQCDWPDGSPFATEPDDGAPRVEPIEAAQSVWSGYEGAPELRHSGDRAYYSPKDDVVAMPPRDSFESSEYYYSVLFHEGTHSTGHAKRLGRDGIVELADGGHGFGSESYAKEELVAELGAAFLCAAAGIENAATLEVSAAYLRHWSERLRSDPKLFVRAAAQAQRAADHILGCKFENGGD